MSRLPLDDLPTLVTLGLLSDPEETIRIIEHITSMAGNWPCPWLTMIGVGDIKDYSANEISQLQSCAAGFVAAFRHSPNRLIPRVTLLSRQEVVQEFLHASNTFVSVWKGTY